MGKLETCLGHITKRCFSRTKPACSVDKKNKDCSFGYKPVIMHSFYVVEKRE